MSNLTINLEAPRVAHETIAQKITCIRAHRERIFRVALEMQGNKVVLHNYGQGGAGWTFLFGCVQESIRQFEEHEASRSHQPIVVIGAGCYGLLTACMLAFQGYNITIVAQERKNIPSHNAAGFFFPRARKSSTELERSQFFAMGADSYRTYKSIFEGKHPFIKRGPQELWGYFDPENEPGYGPYVQAGLIGQPEYVNVDFGSGKVYDLIRYRMLYTNPAVIMEELKQTVSELGIPIVDMYVQSLDEIDAPIIFNCAGMGAAQFAEDARMIPVQGHLLQLCSQPAPDKLNYLLNVRVMQESPKGYMRSELIYFAPKGEGIVGITFKRGTADRDAHPEEFDRLIERCQRYFGT